MGTVVMVADAWKPSVVQIVPFANRTIKRHSSFKEASSSTRNQKCFPILAVTRSQTGVSVNDSVVTVDTYESLTFSDYKSEISESGRTSISSVKTDKVYRKSARHSSMRENRSEMMVKFAVQDLNEQLEPGRNSVLSNDTGIAMSTVSANTGSTVLPKPTFTDKKFLYKQNGFKKTIYTPGEIELQKQKEEYAKEQAQKRKRYKLNVNQLPRSNTPINDHDPDKLNMKQVIRFLQKQKPAVSPRQDLQRSQSVERQSTDVASSSAPYELAVGNKIRSDLKTSQSMRSRSREINFASRSKLMSRDSDVSSRCSSTHTVHSHVSRQNGRIHKYENAFVFKDEKRQIDKEKDKESISTIEIVNEKNKAEETHSTGSDSRDKSCRSSREYRKDRERSRHSRKPEKKFKLHRFLALAPNGEGQKTNPLIISNVAQSSADTWATMRKGLTSESGNKTRSKSEDRLPVRRVFSEKPYPSQNSTVKEKACTYTRSVTEITDDRINGKQVSEVDRYSIGKTNIMHQKSIRFQRMNSKDEMLCTDIEDRKLSLNSASTIRLPSVHDFLEEEDDETVHNSSRSDIDGSCVTQESLNDLELKRETSVSRVSTVSSKSSILVPILSSSPRKGYVPKQKQSLHINLPKEIEETKEIRLSLRQEKDLTARQSYMHDMATSRSIEQKPVNVNHSNVHITSASGDTSHDRSLIRVSAVSMQNNVRSNEHAGISDYHRTPNSIGASSII